MKKILLVEDEEVVREIVSYMLENSGYQVVIADGGHKAANLVREYKFDFIISDVIMKNGDGISLLKKIKQDWKLLTPVMMITGEPNCPLQELKSLGAVGICFKPFTQEIFLRTVQKILE